MNVSNDFLNVRWEQSFVERADRTSLYGHRSLVVWFTGLSGSGKSTLAYGVERRLHQLGVKTFVLDGDNLRHGLCSDLGFSEMDRRENIRRVGEIAKLFLDSGTVVLAALISPFRSDRERVRMLFEPADFLEIHCDCNLDICESRDTKGLYRKARAGLISQFTGISSPYEDPISPEIHVDTGISSPSDCVDEIVVYVRRRIFSAEI